MLLSWELFIVFNAISLLLLYAALIPYCIVQELKRQKHGKYVVCQLCSMILAYTVTLALNGLMLLQRRTPAIGYFISFVCFAHGYLVQYAILAASTWLNVMFFSVWRETRWFSSGRRQMHFDRGKKCFDLVDALYGWGLPLAVTLITTASNQIGFLPFSDTFIVGKPGAITCFFNGSLTSAWIVYITPLVCLTSVNLVLLCLTGHKLFVRMKDTETLMPQIVTNDNNMKNREALCKERLLMYSEVFVIICGHNLVMTILPDSVNMWYIYALCFTLTSLLLFLVYLCSPAALGPVKVNPASIPSRMS